MGMSFLYEEKTEHERITEIRRRFKEIGSKLSILYYASPMNLEEQKALFLSGAIENPSFVYRPLEYNPDEIEYKLNHFDLTGLYNEDELHEKLNDLKQKHTYNLQRGVSHKVCEIARSLYGYPDEELVQFAYERLTELQPSTEPKIVPSEHMKQVLENELEKYGLFDWRIEFSDKNITTMYPFQRKITISQKRLFAENDLKRLPVHEVGVHVLRSVNMDQRNEEVIKTQMRGPYLDTEEGLASYAEEITNSSSIEVQRDYAGRTIAVHHMLQGATFRELFSILQEYGFTDEQAWFLCVRVFRGGGLTKDIAYLQGYRRVKQFVAEGGDILILYIGKVGLQHAPAIKTLLKKGRLTEPKYIPDFLR